MNRTMISNHLTTVKVRMSDSAVLAGAVSLLYALALMVYPRAFPELLERIFKRGYFFPALAVLLLASNEILFVLISRRRAQKPNLLTPGYIAVLTITVVFFFRLLVVAADAQMQISHLLLHTSQPDGISSEVLLVYTHLGMVSGIFVPYLVVRVTQNYVSGANSRGRDVKVRHTAAGR